MAALGPFEPQPHLAVGISGGPDSLALALLLDRWATGRGGRITALTVDHGLRPEAAAEAAAVASRLAARGIAHAVLTWTGPKPASGIQAAARAARFALLERWCAERAVLHLALAHHAEDQAETVLMRLARGSGVDGLAAMAPVSWRRDCRILRPLLGIPRADLAASLDGLAPVDDPSNRDPRHARVRLRHALADLGEGADLTQRLGATARHLQQARAALDQAALARLIRAVRPHEAGFCRVDRGLLAAPPAETGTRALAAVLGMVGGGAYRPRFERLERLWDALRAAGPWAACTLQGCRILAADPAGDALLVVREPAALPPPAELPAGAAGRWDRFQVIAATPGLRVEALGRRRPAAVTALPRAVLPSLPALCDLDGVRWVPHLGYDREPESRDGAGVPAVLFDPVRPLGGTFGQLV